MTHQYQCEAKTTRGRRCRRQGMSIINDQALCSEHVQQAREASYRVEGSARQYAEYAREALQDNPHLTPEQRDRISRFTDDEVVEFSEFARLINRLEPGQREEVRQHLEVSHG